jgi:hypothetical protein
LTQQSVMDQSLTDTEILLRLGRAGIKLPHAETGSEGNREDADMSKVLAAF